MVSPKREITIYPISVLQDNIVWVWVHESNAVVVDPSITGPVRDWLLKRKLSLQAIFQTHHHEDHIGGTPGLKANWPDVKIVASKKDIKRIPFQTFSVNDNDVFLCMGFKVKVLEIPGHTKNHIAFYILDENSNYNVLFSGDTLFAGGCGRLIEGTANEMFNSLNKLNSLPENTKIYCGHEYTENNLKWALSIQSRNPFLIEKLKSVLKKRKIDICSLPSTISSERKTNLFLQAKNIKDFSTLRSHKDNWNC